MPPFSQSLYPRGLAPGIRDLVKLIGPRLKGGNNAGQMGIFRQGRSMVKAARLGRGLKALRFFSRRGLKNLVRRGNEK